MSAAYKLSQPKQKDTKLVKQEMTKSYAASFFESNPDIPIDKRTPVEKLEEIDSKLAGYIEINERFNLLIQKKSLCSLAYGENSLETVLALVELGKFYNQEFRSESALRHLSKAVKISEQVPNLTENDKLMLANEWAEANIATKSKPKVNAALRKLQQFVDDEIQEKITDLKLSYKRDLLIGRAKSLQKDLAGAYESYDRAESFLSQANDGDITSETALLYKEMAECADNCNEIERAIELYERAHETFIELDMTTFAQSVQTAIEKCRTRLENRTE